MLLKTITTLGTRSARYDGGIVIISINYVLRLRSGLVYNGVVFS